MSLLTICHEAAAEAGVAPPATVIDNPETTAIRLLAAARQEIFSMSESAAWSGLVREHSFAAAAASAQPGGLPGDFGHIVSTAPHGTAPAGAGSTARYRARNGRRSAPPPPGPRRAAPSASTATPSTSTRPPPGRAARSSSNTSQPTP